MKFKDIADHLCRWIRSRNSDFLRSELIHVLEIDGNNEVTGYFIVEGASQDKVKIENGIEIPFDIYSIIGRCLAYLTIYDISGMYLVVSSKELAEILKDAIRYLVLPLGLILFVDGSFELVIEPSAPEW